MADQIPDAEARSLRLLRRLVTVLTAVMIGGVCLIVVLLALRLNAPAAPAFPESIALPDSANPVSLTRGPGFLAVVTEDRRIFVLDPTGREILQELMVTLPE